LIFFALDTLHVINIIGISNARGGFLNGVRHPTNPPIDKIETIAKALNVNLTDLIESKENNKIQEKFSKLDVKTLKKLDLILSLSKHDRHIIYLMAETFKNRSKKNKIKNIENQDQ
jgi:transcriptional regulator with XRE-family HTH domain